MSEWITMSGSVSPKLLFVLFYNLIFLFSALPPPQIDSSLLCGRAKQDRKTALDKANRETCYTHKNLALFCLYLLVIGCTYMRCFVTVAVSYCSIVHCCGVVAAPGTNHDAHCYCVVATK